MRSQTQLQTSWSIKPMWMILAFRFEEWLIMSFLGHPLSTDVRIITLWLFSLLFFNNYIFPSFILSRISLCYFRSKCKMFFTIFNLEGNIVSHSGNILLKKMESFLPPDVRDSCIFPSLSTQESLLKMPC